MEDLGAHAQRLAEARRADRHDHELLEIDRVVGMGPAVDHVHHRHRQRARRHAADVPVQRHAELRRRGLRDREADAEDRVRAEPALVVGPVQLDHGLVEQRLLGGVAPEQRLAQLTIHRPDGALDALAEIAGGVAVAQLDRFPRAGRGARRHRRAPHRTAVEGHVHLHGRIAAAVQNLAGVDQGDLGIGHAWLLRR